MKTDNRRKSTNVRDLTTPEAIAEETVKLMHQPTAERIGKQIGLSTTEEVRRVARNTRRKDVPTPR